MDERGEWRTPLYRQMTLEGTTRAFHDGPSQVSHFPRDRWFVIAILVNTVATTVLILIATAGQITVIAVSVASVTGAIDIAAMIALCYKKCRSNPQTSKDRSENPEECHNNIQILPPIINPLTPDEWTMRLRDTPVRSIIPDQYKFYNVLDSSQPLTQMTRQNYPQLPTFGNYAENYKFIVSPRLGTLLPLSQFQGLPESVKKAVNFSDHLELYFLVYLDIYENTTRRNLIPHFMAMPQYQQGRMECDARIAILEPQGLCFYNHENGLSSKEKKFPLILHSAVNGGFAISPNNCSFQVAPSVDLCRFYLAAQFQNRSILCYTLLLRKKDSSVGEILAKAIGKQTLADSLSVLQDPSFPYHQEIGNLFQYYS